MTYSAQVGGATSLLCLLTRCLEIPSGRPFVPTGFQRTQDFSPTWSPRSSTHLFYRRSSPLCLHYGFERLRPITVACISVRFGSVAAFTAHPGRSESSRNQGQEHLLSCQT